MTEQLRPCPFCGGINVIHSGYRMYCHACGAEGPDADNMDESAATEAWNTRAALAQQDAQAASLKQALTDPENQPNQFGVEFLMHGPKFAFKVGVQQFTLDYEPEEPGEFEFMRDALIHAFSTFPPDVKAAQPADVEPVYWEYKHVDDGPDDWQRVVPRTMQTLEVALAEIQGYRMGKKKLYEVRALYTHPPARVPLTEEEIEKLDCIPNVTGILFGDVVKFARAIERAHGIGSNQ